MIGVNMVITLKRGDNRKAAAFVLKITLTGFVSAKRNNNAVSASPCSRGYVNWERLGAGSI